MVAVADDETFGKAAKTSALKVIIVALSTAHEYFPILSKNGIWLRML